MLNFKQALVFNQLHWTELKLFPTVFVTLALLAVTVRLTSMNLRDRTVVEMVTVNKV